MNHQAKRCYEFGPFRLDVSEHVLLRQGHPVPLTPKVFEVLRVLVQNSGRLVEKEELLKEIWPDSFVEEANLNRSVSVLRKALGEDLSVYIQTVPKRGYRFVAQVTARPQERPELFVEERTYSRIEVQQEEEIETDSPKAGLVPEMVALVPSRVRISKRTIGITGCVLLIFGVLLYLFLRGGWRESQAPDARNLRQAEQRLISVSGDSHRAATFSPDGTMIAYVRAVHGVRQIWVKNLAGGDPIQITFGQLAADRPRWSPRNDQIVFTLGSLGRDGASPEWRIESIWSVPPLGGAPRKIIESGGNPNWSGDGSRLVFERGREIWTVGADGSNPRKVEGVPAVGHLIADRMPSLSPDGTLVAFFQPEAGPLGDFWLVPVAGGAARRLTFDVAQGSSPAWTPDGRFVVFSSKRAGSMTLWKVPASGGSVEPVLVSAGEDTDPEISRDASKLIYTHVRHTYVLTVLDPVSRQTRELRKTREILASPMFSPNGEKISFFSHQSDGDVHLYTIGSDGNDLRRMTWAKGERNTFPRWSADGAFLYFNQSRPEPSLRKLLLSGGPSSQLVSGWTWETHRSAHIDSSNNSIICTKMDNNRPVSTIIRDIESGREVSLGRVLVSPQWSNDGRLVLGFQRAEKGRAGPIYICPRAADACEKLTDGYNPSWSKDNSVVYFLRAGQLSDGAELWVISRTGSDEKRIANLRPMPPINHRYDVSPRGEIAYVRFDSGEDELWLTDLPRN